MELNRLYNMDCMEGMKQFPDKYFELAIVDPPYGIDIANRSGTIGMRKSQGGLTQYPGAKKWDASRPPMEYFEELFRVSNNQIISGGNYFADLLPPSRGWVVWIKPQPEGVSFAMSELFWTSFNKSIINITISRSLIQNTTSNNKRIAKSTAKIHPTQKPIVLYKQILSKFAKPGDKILDTHVGSASSLIACIDMGFEFVGFELDPDYHAAATKRMELYQSQLKMF
ncbi:site-specific DNA-methyltransferase [Chitinophaga lutea]|uniref:Methyltransferase n=1 Tax=Chitinophaga lutea TaxID=2488634 RepID=A0A3N4PP70_9BACT|nr:DNA methyltransferase [Chitinophaga lutea]RPE05530.1 site-specific DNA-methyltransferase [Chitinophaga lutea]